MGSADPRDTIGGRSTAGRTTCSCGPGPVPVEKGPESHHLGRHLQLLGGHVGHGRRLRVELRVELRVGAVRR